MILNASRTVLHENQNIISISTGMVPYYRKVTPCFAIPFHFKGDERKNSETGHVVKMCLIVKVNSEWQDDNGTIWHSSTHSWMDRNMNWQFVM